MFTDTFVRADSVTVGNGWTEQNAAAAEILSNNLHMVAQGVFNTNVCYAPASADFQNGTASVDFTVQDTNSVPQLHIRYDPPTRQGYVFFFVSGTLRFDANNDGTLTTLDSAATTLSAGVNYRFTFTILGNVKTCILRNVDTATDLITLTDSVDTSYTALGSTGVSVHTTGNVDYSSFTSTPNDGAAVVITTDVIKNYSGTIQASQAGWIANVYDVTTGALVVRKTGLSTDASGVITLTDVALVAATTYRVDLDNGTLFGNKEYVAV